MSETKLYADFRRKMSGHLLLQRLESLNTGQGIPDLMYCVGKTIGLIELKYLRKWPVRENSIVRLNISNWQQAFLKKWAQGSAPVFIFAQIENDYLLINKNFESIGKMNRNKLLSSCCYFDDCINHSELMALLNHN